jgi:hypothetical protein
MIKKLPEDSGRFRNDAVAQRRLKRLLLLIKTEREKKELLRDMHFRAMRKARAVLAATQHVQHEHAARVMKKARRILGTGD